MSDRYPGGLIRKTPPTITPPVDGEGGSAPGIWTLEQVAYYIKEGTWPKPVLPRELYLTGLNTSGQLGTNDRTGLSSPVQVAASSTWTSISPCVSTTLAVRSDGTLWAWGIATDGKLGTNDVINRSSPVQVGALTNWKIVRGGQAHAGAIKTDGTLWMWGNQYLGRLGNNDGASVDISSPIQIGSDTDWAYVRPSAGANTLFIKTDGTLWACGEGFAGANGTNTVINISSPVQIVTDTNWSVVGAGADQALGLKTDGTLWGWGYNFYGELGQNDRIRRSSPTQVGALTSWSNFDHGYRHVLATQTDGSLWSWGDNGEGQLGQNVAITVDRSSPTQVGAETYWSKVSTFGLSSYAITTSKNLISWGRGNNGQLGQNNIVSYSSPVQIGSDTNWLEIGQGSAATNHAGFFKQG